MRCLDPCFQSQRIWQKHSKSNQRSYEISDMQIRYSLITEKLYFCNIYANMHHNRAKHLKWHVCNEWGLSDDIFVWWPITDCTLHSLFDVHWLHSVCHSLAHSWLTQVNRSFTGYFISVIGSSSPALAALSTFVSSDTHVAENPVESSRFTTICELGVFFQYFYRASA